MQLFKRVLLSLFPDEIITQSVNPASMFVSFISSKEFFSVINRKIVENYRLNLYDIALDSFEFKVWLGDKPSLKLKDIDMYYGFCSVANINGYRFLNPANLSNSVALISAVYLREVFEKYPEEYFVHFLYAVYLLSFVFLARLKIFPYKDEQKNFNWFVDVFFNFVIYVFRQTKTPLDKGIFNNIKKDILWQVDIFFMLFRFYGRFEGLFSRHDDDQLDLKSWLFADDLDQKKYKNILADYMKNSDNYRVSTKFSLTEKKLLNLVLPADILLRYLFMDTNVFLVVEYIVSKVFDRDKLDSFFKWFRKDDSLMDEFLFYISDYKHFKHWFFSGLQKYVMTVFRDEIEAEDKILDEDMDELDELMSSIGDDAEQLESFKVPDRIKKESKLMEKILNFYVTFLWGFWTARWDSFYLRLTKQKFTDEIFSHFTSYDDRPETLNYYGSLLYQYSKNVFYYKYATDNVRAGKQKFFVPYKSTYKKIYSNLSILRFFDENFLYTLLQDLNLKDIRIYVKNKQILEFFKKRFVSQITKSLQKTPSQLVVDLYSDVDKFFVDIDGFSSIISRYISDQDLYNLKENLYSLDFWVMKDLYNKIDEHNIRLDLLYSSPVIMWILSTSKETLFGFLLYFYFVKQSAIEQKKSMNEEFLLDLYVREVLQIAEEFRVKWKLIVLELLESYSDVLSHWVSLDDNLPFMTIVFENRQNFVEKKSSVAFWEAISGEDVIWFRWFLKNLTYYNKRFLIPK